ncbi:MAG: Type 1 glutamine amidotransferase-like domain-containing protein [Clostridia bacterium]|nr:Type 1 glutamine amidotransferase-like domain-containing protein [Clostridia bacterium]
MKVLFLTSYLDCYYRDTDGNEYSQNFGKQNKILDNFNKYIKNYDNFLFVASQNYDTETTDKYANLIFESFDKTLPFKNYNILDHRQKQNAKDLVTNADFIFLSGGHIPSQLVLFEELNLKEIIKETNAVICGGSAGSMDSAKMVYCPPELEGEAINENFSRYREGLGLTTINIYPHWRPELIEEQFLDGKNIYREIMLEDSKNLPFVAFDEGTYILQIDGKVELFGEGYRFENGKCEKIVDKFLLK